MTAPAGAVVSLYVDLVARVAIGDVIETRSGRRYSVLTVREQTRGMHAGRQHLSAMVLADGDELPAGGKVHRIRWYTRARGAGVKGVGRR